jgi:hypothetical protein
LGCRNTRRCGRRRGRRLIARRIGRRPQHGADEQRLVARPPLEPSGEPNVLARTCDPYVDRLT